MIQNTHKTPVRISIFSERYEIAASLFESVYGEQLADGDKAPGSLRATAPEEELMLGILPDGENDYFVKPADPAVLRAQRSGEKNDAIEQLEFYTEGELDVVKCDGEQAGTVVLSYAESELTGMDGTISTVTFRTDDPGLVTMLRSGAVKTALTFRAHHRAICTYDTPYMPFQVGIHALIVDNRLLEDGELILDYIIEIKGGCAERCSMRVNITAADLAE